MKRITLFFLAVIVHLFILGQVKKDNSELVMSMSQRSLVMPGYLTDLKALIAKQAYDFWKEGNTEPYVTHLNVYSALYQANKFYGMDSSTMRIYNQVGFHNNKVTAIRFGGSTNNYYSSSADGTIMKWDLNNPGGVPEVVYKSDNIIRSIDISDDGSLLLAAFYQTGLALMSLEESSQDDISILEDPEPVQAAVLIPGEEKYLSVSKTGELKIKGFTQEVEKVGKTNQKVNELVVDKRDGTIYAGTGSGKLEAWQEPYDVKEDEIEGIIDGLEKQSYFGYELGSFAINCMDISPDGRLLAIGRERGDVILWDIEKKTIERVISSHQSAITDIDFNPTQRMLLTTSRDKTARLWDLNDSRKLPIILDDHSDWVYAGTFDPTGNIILTGSGDRLIRTWPVDPQELANRICLFLDRNMTKDEWTEFVGSSIPFKETCE